MISKALKDFNLPKGVLGKVWAHVHDFFMHTCKLSMLIERSSRSYAFAKIGWKNYDFDSHPLFDLMAFKLRRIKTCLENGYAIHEEADMKALAEAIEICDRVAKENYDEKYFDVHDAKWGEIEVDFSRSTFKTWRKNANTDEEKAQERKETMEIYEKAEKDFLADMDRLNVLFKEHFRAWWD